MPTLNDVLAGSLAQAVQVQQIIDALKGTPNKGVPIALTAVNDTTNYALSVQNDDPTNSRALQVLKSDGTTLIAADATGVTLGSPVNLAAGSINGGTALANGSVSNVKLGSDTARANQLTNGGLEWWQRGAGAFSGYGTVSADRWTIYPSGTDTLSVTKASGGPNGWGTYANVVHTVGTGAGAGGLAQVLKLSDGYNLAGRSVSLSAVVNTGTAGAVRLTLYDATGGAAIANGTAHPGGSTWVTLTVTGTVPGTCQQLWVVVTCTATCTYFLDNVMLVVGSQYADFAPLHPADDLARCQRYYEVIGPSNATSLLIQGYDTAGGAAFRSTYRFVRKVVVPTVTKVGTWNVSNANQPTIVGTDLESVMLQITAVAAGAGYVYNGTAGTYLTVEANP